MVVLVLGYALVTLTPVKLFSQQCYSELGPKKLELSYFSPSYAIFPPSYAIFFFFPPVTLFCYPQLYYFFLFLPVKLKDSVTGGKMSK